MAKKTALIIGAGPAGLRRLPITDPLGHSSDCLRSDGYGRRNCRTFNHHGNRIDLGGHRFFSKSARVTKWWLSKFPLQKIDDAAKEPVKVILGEAAQGAEGIDLENGLDQDRTRSCDARAETHIAHSLSPPILRLSGHAELEYAPQPGICQRHANRVQLSALPNLSDQA